MRVRASDDDELPYVLPEPKDLLKQQDHSATKQRAQTERDAGEYLSQLRSYQESLTAWRATQGGTTLADALPTPSSCLPLDARFTLQTEKATSKPPVESRGIAGDSADRKRKPPAKSASCYAATSRMEALSVRRMPHKTRSVLYRPLSR